MCNTTSSASAATLWQRSGNALATGTALAGATGATGSLWRLFGAYLALIRRLLGVDPNRVRLVRMPDTASRATSGNGLAHQQQKSPD